MQSGTKVSNTAYVIPVSNKDNSLDSMNKKIPSPQYCKRATHKFTEISCHIDEGTEPHRHGVIDDAR